MRRILVIVALAMVAAAAVGCGSGQATTSSDTVDIYSSFPLQGASGVQGNAYVNGIQLALEQAGGKAGQ